MKTTFACGFAFAAFLASASSSAATTEYRAVMSGAQEVPVDGGIPTCGGGNDAGADAATDSGTTSSSGGSSSGGSSSGGSSSGGSSSGGSSSGGSTSSGSAAAPAEDDGCSTTGTSSSNGVLIALGLGATLAGMPRMRRNTRRKS